MDALEKLNQQINREITCIEDITVEIQVLARKGQFDITKQREQDLHNSLEQLERLHRKKELWTTVVDLNQQGILVQVVKKHAHQA